jgi:predicted alpha/beta superfamily hydrolase
MKLLSYVFVFISAIHLVNAQAAPAFEIPRSHIIELKDSESDRVYPIFIKLPRSYLNNSDKLYPVIYLTDALYSFQVVSGATRFPMNAGKMKEAIIVGISYSKGSGGHSSRVRDFTHREDSSWKFKTGKAKNHVNFINQSVFSYIEKNYRVNGSRTFVGNSLGGLFGAYIFFTRPNMFNNYILGSPSTWFKNNDILNIKTKLNLNKYKVFIAVGENETPDLGASKHNMVAGAKKLKLKISGGDYPNTEVNFLTIKGANHETAFPTTAIQGLYWLFKTP